MKKILTFLVCSIIGLSGAVFSSDNKSTTNEKIFSSSVMIQAQIKVDAPASAVWPHLVQRKWVTDFVYVTVAGEPGREGHLRRLYSAKLPIEEQKDKPALLLEAVKIVPGKIYYAENPPSMYGDRVSTGFNFFSLLERNGNTTVSYIGGKEFSTSSRKSYEAIEKSLDAIAERVEKNWVERYLPTLKKIVEESKTEMP